MVASSEATTNWPVDSSKFDWRLSSSRQGGYTSHRMPRLIVSFLVARQSSWT
jgi:hypothetical protein